MGNKEVLINDIDQFMKSEFELRFKRAFKDDFEHFDRVMKSETRTCSDCGSYYFKGCTKKCECDYNQFLAKQKQPNNVQ